MAAGAPDGRQVRALLHAALRESLRSGGRVLATRSRRPRGLIFLVALYALMGGFVGAAAFMRPDLFTYALLLQSMTLFIGGMTLVAESPNLLFSLREQEVLGHRPIHPRTLLMARALRLLALTLVLTLSLNLAPTFFVLALGGASWWTPFAHLITTLLTTVFCAGVVVFVYVILTRLVGRERFDGFATWVQVGVSVAFILGYQILPRLIDRAHGLRVSPMREWLWLLPPAWFAALESLLGGGAARGRVPVMAAAAVIVPLGVGWAALGRLAAGYSERLTSLAETPVARSARRAGGAARGARRMHPLLKAWMRDPVERGAFGLAAAYMKRDRDIRMRLYPSLASLLIFPLMPLFDREHGSLAGPMMALVMAGTLPVSTMLTLKMSAQYAASDVFRYAPMRGTAAVFHGVRKATLLFVTLPGLALSATVLWFTVPRHALLLDVLPVLVVLPTLSLMLGVLGDYLPFSVPPTVGRQAGTNIGTMLVSMLVVAVLYAAGEVSRRFGWFWPLLAVEVVIVTGFHVLLLRGIRARVLVAE